jgi:hypothetical protein
MSAPAIKQSPTSTMATNAVVLGELLNALCNVLGRTRTERVHTRAIDVRMAMSLSPTSSFIYGSFFME